ncbi:hypothetical protein GOP47_0030914 [Adiantum capillus-veneris]|nr:hypothetical protein GOP47_0030914 [Adiantum capillus-veneris]
MSISLQAEKESRRRKSGGGYKRAGLATGKHANGVICYTTLEGFGNCEVRRDGYKRPEMAGVDATDWSGRPRRNSCMAIAKLYFFSQL